MANTADLMWLSTAAPSIVTSGLVLNLNPSTYTSGATWNDSSPSGYNAALTGSPTFTSSGAGSYFTLNGTSQYVSVPNTATNLNDMYLTGYTYQVWGKYSVALGAQPVVSKGNGSSGQGQRMTYMDQTSPITMDILNDMTGVGTEKAVSSTNAPAIAFGLWCQATFVFTSGSLPSAQTQMHLYINGVEYATTSGNSDTWTTTPAGTKGSDSASPTYFGYSAFTDYYNIGSRTSPRYGAMSIGQILVYNIPLSATAVLQNFTATRTNYGV